MEVYVKIICTACKFRCVSITICWKNLHFLNNIVFALLKKISSIKNCSFSHKISYVFCYVFIISVYK